MTPQMSCELAHRHDPGQAQCIDEGQTHGGPHGGASVSGHQVPVWLRAGKYCDLTKT